MIRSGFVRADEWSRFKPALIGELPHIALRPPPALALLTPELTPSAHFEELSPENTRRLNNLKSLIKTVLRDTLSLGRQNSL